MSHKSTNNTVAKVEGRKTLTTGFQNSRNIRPLPKTVHCHVSTILVMNCGDCGCMDSYIMPCDHLLKYWWNTKQFPGSSMLIIPVTRHGTAHYIKTQCGPA